jgi:hypothetical protein
LADSAVGEEVYQRKAGVRLTACVLVHNTADEELGPILVEEFRPLWLLVGITD